MADIPVQAHRALANSPMAEPLLPPRAEAITSIAAAEVQNGFTVTADGAIHVNITTEMPIELPMLRIRLNSAVPSLRSAPGSVVKATVDSGT